MKCTYQDCQREAIVAIKTSIPAKGRLLSEPALLECCTHLRVCGDHASVVRILDVYPQDVQDHVSDFARGLALPEPDFRYATLKLLDLDDPEVVSFDLLAGLSK